MFAVKKYEISAENMAIYPSILKHAIWEIVPGRGYQTWDVTDRWHYYRAFFLKLPPHTELHRHVDAGDVQTDHIVIQTNPQCLNWWMDGDKEQSEHLELGFCYAVDRTVMHWATNHGETDRIHLLIEQQ